MQGLIRVEIAYARPGKQVIVPIEVSPGTTLGAAIRSSGVLERFIEIDLTRQACGVFGQRRPLDYVLQPGDRVEIYRPLTIDPKAARRRRAIAER